jgi:3'-phosphoadenosine 5'-phosphosulfate sulfotransferase (PAPS reductase)/FAD synthetase
MNNFIVDGVEIPFEHDWNIIAISVSGGADSALLAYLLCKYISDHNLKTDILPPIRQIRRRC